MKSKELLLKHLTLNDCKGYVTSDGRLYKAIIDALDEALTIGGVSNNEVALKAFVEEYVEAFEDGQGSDTTLYRQAKSLL